METGRFLPLVFAGASFVAAAVAASGDLEKYGDQNHADAPREGNPIVPGLFADPSLAKFGDTFYLYATTDGFGWDTGRWVVWRSKDFVHWSFSGESFPEITGQKNWAPGKPVFRGGKYWFPFTLNGDHNVMAFGDRPEGPFHFAGKGRALTPGIDAEIFLDDDQTPYLISGAHQPGIWRLKPDLSAIEDQLATLDFKKGYVEGAFLFKRKGIYYAGAANLGYAQYRLIYAMSDRLEGPWHWPENNVIIEPVPKDHLWGTGHGHVLPLPGTDEWILIYLRSRMGEDVDPFRSPGNVYRQICAERLTFNADGTIRSVPATRRGVGLLAPDTSVGTNVAFGKTASASSSRERYEPEKAVDESFGTRWIAGPGEPLLPTAETSDGHWRWTVERPAENWMKIGFKDAAWSSGPSGFGTAGTPDSRVGTPWKSDDVWLRREFTLPADFDRRAVRLRLHHDDDAEVYLNGVLGVKAPNFSARYENLPLLQDSAAALRPGKNLLAVHCRQTGYDQYIDAGLVAVSPPWWQVDLGRPTKIERTEISFNYPTEITPYLLEFSLDGRTWQTYADRRKDREFASPKVDRKSVVARYFRVIFPLAEKSEIPAGLWEFKAFDAG